MFLEELEPKGVKVARECSLVQGVMDTSEGWEFFKRAKSHFC